MALYYNGTDLKAINYNGTDLKEVYYNDVLVWRKTSTDKITLTDSYSPTGDSSDYKTIDKSFGKNISPISVTMDVNSWNGTATWHGAPTVQLYLYNVNTSSWQFIVERTRGTGTAPWTIDISGSTSGKWYSQMRMRYGGVSRDGSVTTEGSISLNEYYY